MCIYTQCTHTHSLTPIYISPTYTHVRSCQNQELPSHKIPHFPPLATTHNLPFACSTPNEHKKNTRQAPKLIKKKI